MRLGSVILSLLISTTGVAAQISDDPAVRWMARLMFQSSAGQPLTLAVIEPRLVLVMTAMNNTIPRFNDVSIRLDQMRRLEQMRLPRKRAQYIRAQYIARFLEKDLDNDGKVTSEELKTALEPQAQANLRSTSGIEIEPTPEQIDGILQQLMARDLQADSNNDGTVDFDEMRAAAKLSAEPANRIDSFRVLDRQVFKLLDTSGDKKIGEDESRTVIRKTFAILDRDKNGIVSADEMKTYLVGVRQF
jgi:Ca2+-binding EF-hand superfamily protein